MGSATRSLFPSKPPDRHWTLALLAIAILVPTVLSANAADLFVIGVDIDLSDPRAYPIEILNYHEIVNDVIAGRQVAITWSPLTQSNLLLHTESLLPPRTIGTSGKLYQNNLVAYDRATHTYWSQMGGFSLKGPLLGSNLIRGQSLLTKWSTWKRLYPHSKVLNRPPGSTRDYLIDPYHDYRLNDRLIFDSCFETHRTESPYRNKGAKEETLVVFTDRGNSHLFPISETTLIQNIEDLDNEHFVVLWDRVNAFSLAYNRIVNGTSLSFFDAGNVGTGIKLPMLKDRPTGSIWNASGTCISGPLLGTQLRRLTSFSTYWSAATSFFPKSQIWSNSTTLQYFPSSCLPKPSPGSECAVPCSAITTAGPIQDAVRSIDSPIFMTPAEFEAIVRVPRRVISAYFLLLAFFIVCAIGVFAHTTYQKWQSKPAESNMGALEQATGGGAAGAGTGSADPTSRKSFGSKQDEKQDDTQTIPLVLKEDDEEEPVLPPEREDDVPKFMSPVNDPPPRRRKRNKKHMRSVSLLDDDTMEVQMDTMKAPLTARVSSSRKFSAHGFPVPRLSMPLRSSMSPPFLEQPARPMPRNKSDGSLMHMAFDAAASSSGGPTLNSHGALASPSSQVASPASSPRYGAIPELDELDDFHRTPHYATTIAAPPQRTKRHSHEAARTRTGSGGDRALPTYHQPLLHRASAEIPPQEPLSPRAGFDAALRQSKEYSTSTDSGIMGDNYQLSLSSVPSDSDYIPERIISPAALARIQGKVAKPPSVLADQVFQQPAASSSSSQDTQQLPAQKRSSTHPDEAIVPLDY